MVTYELVAKLLNKDLIITESLVAGSLRISDASYRNTNFRVECEPGPSYLLKQGVGTDKIATVLHEAAVYGALQVGGAEAGVARYLPRFFGYEAADSTLILELVPDAETLSDRHARTGKFSVGLAQQMGHALAALHSITRQGDPGLYEVLGRSIYGGAPHWILSVHRPYLRDLGLASNANLHTVKIIQRFPEFCALLDTLKHEWLGGDEGRRAKDEGSSSMSHTPIHCDIKWNNIIIQAHSLDREPDAVAERRPPAIRLVDWELARLGDPCWDVGSFFGEYLTFWLLSIPVTGQDPPDRFLDLARYPLEKMRPALRAFWTAYAQDRGLADPSLHYEFLLRSVRYAAARLVQTAYEQGQTSALLTGNIVVLLQLAFNILQRPSDAAIALLGIPLSLRRTFWQ